MPLPSKGWWAQGHVFWDGKPRTRWKKGIVGSWHGKSRVLGGETTDQLEKRIVGAGWVKTTGETRAQSPKSILSNGGRYKSVNPGLGSSHDEFLHDPYQ